MTTKEYFNSIRKLKARIGAKEIQIETLRELATNISPSYSGMPHEPPKTTSPMADAICKALDMEAEVARLKETLRAEELKAMELIGRVESTEEQNLLVRRYIRLEPWEDIARHMYYSESSIYRLHRNAIKTFDTILASVTVDDSR